MRVRFDPEANAAYIALPRAEGASVARSHVCDVHLDESAILLDFDAEGRLLGVELLGASRLLPGDALDAADRP